MKYDLVVKNGNVVLEDAIRQTDIGIGQGVIQAIGENLDGAEVVDARDMLVLPGGIDPHVHIEMQYGNMVTSDDWVSGTRAAAIGGTTTIFDFIDPIREKSLMDVLSFRKALAENRAVIDYSMHMALVGGYPDSLREIPQIVAAGIPSFKIYTTYAGQMADGEILAAMTVIARAGGVVMVHCENDAIVEHMRAKLVSEGKVAAQFHPLSRPVDAEGEAVERIIALANQAGVNVYIVHVSSGMGMDAIARAQARGQAVWGETCTQYLLLNEEEYARPGFEPAKYLCQPPLREKANNARLLSGLSEGVLQTIGSDHCPFFYNGQKDVGRDVFTKIPGGLPGIESRLALTYTRCVVQGGLDVNQWVRAVSTNTARIFGIYPQKGVLKAGSDADIAIFDPARSGVVSKSMLHEHVDHTPYEGIPYQGYSLMTIARGEIIAREGSFVGQNHKGKFIARKPASK
jgi:dihydropyrimidinase